MREKISVHVHNEATTSQSISLIYLYLEAKKCEIKDTTQVLYLRNPYSLICDETPPPLTANDEIDTDHHEDSEEDNRDGEDEDEDEGDEDDDYEYNDDHGNNDSKEIKIDALIETKTALKFEELSTSKEHARY